MSFLSVGCDIAKDTFDAAIWLDEGIRLGTLPNTKGGFAQLFEKVAAHNPTQLPVLLVLEPTGGYELRLAVSAREQGWQVALPNPRQVRDWAKGVGIRTKSDPQDSLMLAQYGMEQKPESQEALSPEVAELNALLKRQDELKKMRRSESNRLQQLQQQPQPSPTVTDSLERSLERLEKELKGLKELIKAHIKSAPELQELAKRLLDIPGVGRETVASLIVLLHQWSKRTNGKGEHKSLVAFVGLDSQTNQSGKSRKRATISKMGAPKYRAKLYMAALGGVRGNNALKYFYQRLVGRGKPKKLALVAASRKILVWAHALFTTGEAYDPSKHPIPQTAS